MNEKRFLKFTLKNSDLTVVGELDYTKLAELSESFSG
jgi:hypothetical protein